MKPLLPLFIICCTTALLPAQDFLQVSPERTAYDSVYDLLLVQVMPEELPAAADGIATPSITYAYLREAPKLSYDSTYRVVTGEKDTLDLAFTPLPLIQISSSETIIREAKVPGFFTYGYGAEILSSPIALRYRGSYSLRYPKKSLDLEFREPTDLEESRDVTFLDMREDDDWVLDALYNEPSRVNAYVGHKVWLDLHQLSYAAGEPKAKAGADVEFAELFLNGRYHGLYLLSEQVDRTQLKLKKYDDDAGVRGVLYKSEEYTSATSFQGVPNESPKDDDWAGWEVKHPDEDEVDWDQLRDLIRFVSASPDSVFLADAAGRFDLDNLVDYLLFVNGLRLTDNVSKNTYLARYDSTTPYFFAPWDLDAGLGNAYNAERITNLTAWSTNGLFRRLTDLSPDNFNDRLCGRYNELRENIFRTDSLQARVTTAMDFLHRSGAYRREARRWPALLNFSEEQATFTTNFIEERLDFLDGYVCAITTPTTDDYPDAKVALRVYPNPANGYLIIDGPAKHSAMPYALYTAAGREVLRGAVAVGGRIDLPALPAGLYFLRIDRQALRVVIGR